ncbi:MAG: TfoX/Sxy family protein [Candidatus Thorarchaeota archaeon]|jgi:TfoX/Sxy family transcriptional regulator of competence genes
MSWGKPSDALFELLRETLEGVDCEMKRMFGQYAFFMNGNMSCGVHESTPFLRMAPEDQEKAMAQYPELKKFEPREGMVMKEYVQASGEFAANLQDFRRLLTKSIEYARGLPPRKRTR